MTQEQSAQEHLDNALAASLADETEAAITEFETALALGLPGDREAFARVNLGGHYVRRALRRGLPIIQAIQLPEWKRAESEIITGLRVDREGNYARFADRNGRSLLSRFDIMCDLAGGNLAKENSQTGIDYLETMISHCDYLPSSPLTLLYLAWATYTMMLGTRRKLSNVGGEFLRHNQWTTLMSQGVKQRRVGWHKKE